MDTEQVFNQAWTKCLHYPKLLLVFLGLYTSCALMFVFIHLMPHVPYWIAESFFAIPWIMSVSLSLFFATIFFDLEQEDVFTKPLDHILQHVRQQSLARLPTTYTLLPMLLGFTCLWLSLGFFDVLSQIPLIGSLVQQFLPFVPFVVHLLLIWALPLSALSLFALPVEFQKNPWNPSFHNVWSRIARNPFRFCKDFLLSITPLACSFALVCYAYRISIPYLGNDLNPLESLIAFIPIAMALSPSTLFFLHYSQIAHDSCHKRICI